METGTMPKIKYARIKLLPIYSSLDCSYGSVPSYDSNLSSQALRAPSCRDLFFKPPKRQEFNWGIYWRPNKLPYGVVDSGHQFLKVSDEWMLYKFFTCFFGINQLFISRDSSSTIKIIVAKTIDDVLVGGETDDIQRFLVGCLDDLR